MCLSAKIQPRTPYVVSYPVSLDSSYWETISQTFLGFCGFDISVEYWLNILHAVPLFDFDIFLFVIWDYGF